MLVAPGLEHEDHLIDARGLVAGDQVADLLRGADRAAQRPQPLLEQLHAQRRLVGTDDVAGEARALAVFLKLAPDVGYARKMVVDAVVVHQRVAEEVRAVDASLDRLRLVLGQHHRQDDRDVRVDRQPGGNALVRGEDLVVLVDPFAGVLGLDE